ncbi:MAG: hypothetical protein HDT28_04355 [Clostridiales bacterium]|nr:hypothetical protein [Clostridiales bacterium]
MEIKNKYETKLQAIALSSDSFTTGYFVMCLLMFVPFIATSQASIITWFLPLCCLIPLAVMPLFYLLVHRVDMLLFGRYHLVMPISAFVSAISFVMMFTNQNSIALVFIGALVFAVSITLYRYCAFSVRARLGGFGITSHSLWSGVFSVLGAVGALASYAGFMYADPETMYINCAYVISLTCVVLAMVQYLVTHYGIPKLVGRRALTVKSVYRTFYTGLDIRLFVSSFLFQAAFACIAALLLFFTAVRGIWIYTTVFVALAVVCGYGAMQSVSAKYVTKCNNVLLGVLTGGFAVSSALLIIASVVPMNIAGFTAIVIVTSVIVGACGALCVRLTKLRVVAIKPHITSGVVYILTELVTLLAFAVALLAAAIVVTIWFDLTSFICGFAVAAVLATIALAISVKKISSGDDEQPAELELGEEQLDAPPQADGEAEETEQDREAEEFTEGEPNEAYEQADGDEGSETEE